MGVAHAYRSFIKMLHFNSSWVVTSYIHVFTNETHSLTNLQNLIATSAC